MVDTVRISDINKTKRSIKKEVTMMEHDDERRNEEYLVIYKDRSELHMQGEVIVCREGPQDEETQRRFQKLKDALKNGYLEKKYDAINSVDLSDFSERNKRLLKQLVQGVTSTAGRAVVGLAFCR